MSSRQLKKLHQQQELLRLQQLADNEDASSEEEVVAPHKPRASAFAGFAALEDAEEDDDAGQEDEEKEEVEEVEAEPVAPTPAKRSKKSKKKKKAKKAEAAQIEDKGAKSKGNGGLDEIDLALKELSMKPKPQTTTEQDTGGDYDANLARLLSISFDHLKVINELRAMFGQDTIDSVRNQEEEQSREDRRRNARRGPTHANVDLETFLKGRPGEKIPDVVLRKNPFVQGKDFWPRASAGGLKMTAVTDERVEPTEFRFSHDRSYEMLEVQFYNLVDMMDPMRIVHFIHENPYEVNGLITTSRVAIRDSNAALASDLLERALFTFGRVTLSSFRKKLERGVARLEFRRPENRQFWLAGYHYIKSLMQKGTYNTALEWTKLFLGLSPKDEYAMMNFTHVLAIYAYEAKWFIDLCNSSYFNSDEYDLPMKEYHRQTCVLAKLQLKDREGALKDLVKGMETLPWLYSSLCSAVNIDTPRPIWGVQPRNDDDALYTELYVHMAKDLWKREPDATSLLKEAGGIASKVDVHTLPFAQEVPLSIGRFIYLDNTPELMGLVPPKMLHASPNFDYDPLPPPEEENIFSSEWQRRPWQPAGSGDDFRRGQMDSLVREAQRMMQAERAAQGLPEEPADAAVGDDAAPAEEGGFLSRLARMLLPVWMARGGEGQNVDEAFVEEMMREISGEPENPWEDYPSDTDEDIDLPALIAGDGSSVQGDDHAGEEREDGDDEEGDIDIPHLEPAE
ncbi:Ribosome quality control complex subunit 1 [Cytospora mali]|uniref:Ribosome quality control complex subunit 1 n=1 Tax=Cytospora mali TaxID=578113 RepID=A0A194UNJ8_CYTMA|nr:Ribosome quality control complex subunit 1 [Valsa mali var. pyri (nom. inval.)]